MKKYNQNNNIELVNNPYKLPSYRKSIKLDEPTNVEKITATVKAGGKLYVMTKNNTYKVIRKLPNKKLKGVK